MNQVSVDLRNPYCPWHTSQRQPSEGSSACRVWVRGQAWEANTYLEGKDLATWLGHEMADLSVPAETAFKNALHKLNGCYALVVLTPDQVLAAVDRWRSIPLFYGTIGDAFLLSDDPYTVRRFVGDTELDDTASQEFLLTGYVTGADTLSPNVKQIQAGEYVHRGKAGGIAVNAIQYYRFLHGDYLSESEDELCSILERTLHNAFERLLASIRGNRIVVPLSGGKDSRAIVAMLKLLGMDNVLCFSYGKPGNWESAISQIVAERLGYEWRFVPYTRRRCREWFRSEERQTFAPYGGTLVSLPILQDWAAVWELKKAGHLAKDDVIVPGHSGFVAGGHTPTFWAAAESVEPLDVAQAILQDHYVLWKWRPCPTDLELAFQQRVADRLDEGILNGAEAIDAYVNWEWQERQSKFIVNNVRVYEFWGYDWRLPLCDHGLMSLFERVPVEMRIGKKLLISYLEKKLSPRFGIQGLNRESLIGAGSRPTGYVGGHLNSFMDRQRERWSKVDNPALGRYSVLDEIRTWRAYNQRFGNGWRRASARSLLNSNTIRAYLVLRSTVSVLPTLSRSSILGPLTERR